ncbi:MAG: hypothetical protein IH606_06245 [Burkholderiales bacterium]|nr:hypothetical protein [Burkholderiales bacterium]
MTKTGALDAILDTAEVDLSSSAISSIDVNAGCDATTPNLDRVRPYCRELRASLGELDKLDCADNVETARANCRDLRTVLIALNPSATIPFHCDAPTCSLFHSPRTTCWGDDLEALIALDRRPGTSSINLTRTSELTPDEAIRQSDIDVWAQNPDPKFRP